MVLSQAESPTSASNWYPRAVSSIESAMTSRLTSDVFIPFVPIVIPSEIATVLNSIGVPPAARTPSLIGPASARRWKLHGMASIHVLATPMVGRRSASSSNPIPFMYARACARSGPSNTPAERGRGSSVFVSSAAATGSSSVRRPLEPHPALKAGTRRAPLLAGRDLRATAPSSWEEPPQRNPEPLGSSLQGIRVGDLVGIFECHRLPPQAHAFTFLDENPLVRCTIRWRKSLGRLPACGTRSGSRPATSCNEIRELSVEAAAAGWGLARESEDVNRTGAAADFVQSVTDCFGRDLARPSGGVRELRASGEEGGKGGGMSASGAVGGARRIARAVDPQDPVAIEQGVGALV